MNRPDRKLILLLTLGVFIQLLPAIAHCQTPIPLTAFRSVALRGGGKVILSHGAEQKITLFQGKPGQTRLRVKDERLIIDRCQACPHDEPLVVEIITPDFEDLMVTDGGTIEVRGRFPARENLRAAVEDGGTIDVRSVEVQSVAALVQQGGRILTRAQKTLLGSISHGGVITYWGSPNVSSHVDDGGMVMRGKSEELDKTLEELSEGTPELPPVPSVTPIPVIKSVPPTKRRTTS